MTITLGELKTQARDRADMAKSGFVSDSELTTYINSSIAELFDILIQAYSSDYYISTYIFTSVPNQDTYALPADWYKLRGVDAKLNGSDFLTVSSFNFNERNRFKQDGVWNLYGVPTIRYRQVGDNIVFEPTPDGAVQIKLWYVPLAVKLVADGDILKDLNQFSEYVVVDTAIKMRVKEETDTTVLETQKAALLKRITDAAQNRDVGESESVSDVYAENDMRYFWRTGN